MQSKKNGRFYIGQTKDIEDRLQRHNAGHSKSTKPYRPCCFSNLYPMILIEIPLINNIPELNIINTKGN
ncbi:MAG: GIY-YIG nuclease family protein [Candidatus Marinimicrobia bacterium]|nr:GIY-YIG nuclease family protein [Candidatus Neomarinimicrobiota bacterium]